MSFFEDIKTVFDTLFGLKDIRDEVSLSEASKKLAREFNELGDLFEEERRILYGPDGLNGHLQQLSDELKTLCADLTHWAEKCTCSGVQQTSGPVVAFDFPISFNYIPGGATGQVGATARGLGSVAPQVNVEVHNYGDQVSKTGSNSGGRDMVTVLGEAMARDVRRGGPLGRSIQHTYGTGRISILR
jgi:hypothetical protein